MHPDVQDGTLWVKCDDAKPRGRASVPGNDVPRTIQISELSVQVEVIKFTSFYVHFFLPLVSNVPLKHQHIFVSGIC